jgi:PAS domain S-box-containing protein
MNTDPRAFEVVAEAISDGIVVADEDSCILWCNAGAASMFGWPADEVAGRALTDLMPERYREAHLSGMARLLAGGEPRLVGRGPVEVEAIGASGNEIPVELTLSRWTAEGGSTRFVAVLRDVTGRRRAEQERDTQLAVARALAAASQTERAACEVLQALAEAMGWDVGALWLVDEEASALRCAHVWGADEDTAGFRQATQQFTFTRGVGLPGRVWDQRRPMWLRDVARDDNFPRLPAAAEAGLHGAVAMPIMAGDTFVGVLEFFSEALRTPDPAVEAILEATSDQFAQFFRRKHAEDELLHAHAELEKKQFAQRQTAQINDNIIHWLVKITQALDAGDQRAAQRASLEALQQASRIITDLGALPRLDRSG